MSVVTYNSNLLPSTFNGVYKVLVPPPSTQGFGVSNQIGTQTTNVLAPVQIGGLVPVFPCCIPTPPVTDPMDAAGDIIITLYGCDYSGGYQFQIVINGTNYGTITIAAPTTTATPASIEAIINANLASIGVTSNVLVMGGSLAGNNAQLGITLFAPSGTGSAWNGYTVGAVAIQCVKILSTLNFQGGRGFNSLCQCDCRQGEYFADSVADDRFYQLPVFASTTCTDSYHNDVNQWWFSYPTTYDPIANGDFRLQKLTSGDPVTGTWTLVATLNNSTYGIPTTTAATCSQNIGGFQINWVNVLAGLGEGIYRFVVFGSYNGTVPKYCFFTPPFCLKTFDCYLANGTVKFMAASCGGTIGSVTDQGVSWSICCTPLNNGVVSNTCTNGALPAGQSGPLPFNDSIRFPGYFGKETADYQETNIKMATGYIQKTRQEAIKNFQLDSDLVPFWLHQRFYAYGLMSDNLTVNDYNMNNPNYNYKSFSVVRDSSYPIKYSDNSSRYKKIVGLKFKEGVQFTFKDGCC